LPLGAKDRGAFVEVRIDDARAAADTSTALGGRRPLSAIDGMPIGIKDIIETANMATQMSSPLFEGWRSTRCCGRCGIARSEGVILGRDSDDRIRGDRAAWHPQPLGLALAGRLQRRLGRRVAAAL
jgi:hypothetical protein